MPAPLDSSQLAPWVEVRFDRSSGPGGQNVNKLNTRVSLLFDFRTCDLLTDWQRRRIEQRCGSRLSADGRLRIVAQQARTQLANRALAEQRLLEILSQAWTRLPPRKATRPSAASKRRRLDEKRRLSDRKRERRPPQE